MTPRSIPADERDYPLVSASELGAGVRIGGKFDGPRTGTSAIWVGRPPVLPNGYPFPTLAIAATPSPSVPGQTVTIEVEAANGFGGRIMRQFSIGGGLSAEMRLGNYQHVRVRVLGSSEGHVGIPAGMTVWFAWSFDLVGHSSLFHFLNYPVAGVPVVLPEGTEYITPENACRLVFQVPEFGTTFTRGVNAGEQATAIWSAFTCNIINRFIVQLRGL